MSGTKSKAGLPPLLLTRSQLDLYASQASEFTFASRARLFEGSWEDIDRLGYYPVMAQCSRVQRPPPPPHYIAQSRKNHSDSGVTVEDGFGLGLPSDPARRVKQLERNIAFMRESHAVVLRSLHLEVEELKIKNRDLVLQLVINNPSQASGEDKDGLQAAAATTTSEASQEATKKIEKLEKEVRKLRCALREALKVNGNLNAQLETMKHLSYSVKSQSALDLSTEGNQRSSTPGSGSSPKMDEYSDTLHQIQQLSSASRTKSCKTISEAGVSGRGAVSKGSDWTGTGARERSRRHSDFQPHLPRLPLRANQQQNPPAIQQMYESQSYQSRDGGEPLPSLKKPMFPMLQQQQQQQQGPQQSGQGTKGEERGGGGGGGNKGRKARGGQRGRSSIGNSGQQSHHHHHQGHHH